ncbi:MAG TPA: PKD domain-containing protein [Thermoleophilaceae bacterium]
MKTFQQIGAVSAAVAAMLAIGTASASAATFCVNSPPGCSGTPETTIAGAIADAAGSPGLDEIQIAGDHTYDENGLAANAGNPVAVAGVDVNATPPTITDDMSSMNPMLDLGDTGSTATNVAFAMPAGAGNFALSLSGPSASNITVTGPAVDVHASGVELLGTGSVLSDSTVTLAASPTANATQGFNLSGDGEVVRDSTFQAASPGFIEGGSGTRVTRVTAVGPQGIEQQGGAGNVIEDSLLVVKGDVGFNGFGLLVDPNLGPTSLTANNVTVVDGGAHGSTQAAGAQAVEGSGPGSSLTLRNSIVRGFDIADLRKDGADTALDTDYDDWGTSNAADGASPVVRGPHDVDVDPGFANAPGGDFHLVAGSPLVDAGDPAGLAAGDSATDLYGGDRLAAGLGGCAYVRDIGAAEFQPSAPTAKANAPATAVAGSRATFNSTGSCGPSANVGISFAWRFDDGASASGATVTHAFSRTGTHTATLTVTDANGHAAASSAVLDVTARRASVSRFGLSPRKFRAAGRGGSTAAAAARRKKPGTRVSYRLNVAARVRFVVRVPRHGKHKARTLPGSFTVRGKAGANHFRFTGRLRHRKLAPRRYLLVATPGSGATKGKTRSLAFRIVR